MAEDRAKFRRLKPYDWESERPSAREAGEAIGGFGREVKNKVSGAVRAADSRISGEGWGGGPISAFTSGVGEGFNPTDMSVSPMARTQEGFPEPPRAASPQVNYENFAAQAGGRVPEALGGGFATEGPRITNTGGRTVLTNVGGIPDIDSGSSIDADAYTARMNQQAQRGFNPEPAVDQYAFDTNVTASTNDPDGLNSMGASMVRGRQEQRQRTYNSLTAQGIPPAVAREQVLVEENKPPSFANALRSQLMERLASRAGADYDQARAESTRTQTGFLPEVTEAGIGLKESQARQADAIANQQNATAVAALMPEPQGLQDPIEAPMQVGTDPTGSPIFEDRAFIRTEQGGFRPFEDAVVQPQPGTAEGFRAWARRQMANPENTGVTQTELLEIYRERFPEFSPDGA